MSRTRRPFAALLTITLGLLLTSCAARAPLPPPDAATAWQRFEAAQDELAKLPSISGCPAAFT